MDDRSWMYRDSPQGLRRMDYCNGVQGFMNFATSIPRNFRDLLPKGIWDALTEISHFFRDICSSKLNVEHIERVQTNIVETLCKLEMIFPPSFFLLNGASPYTSTVRSKSWRTGPIQMDVPIRTVRYYSCNVIHIYIKVFYMFFLIENT